MNDCIERASTVFYKIRDAADNIEKTNKVLYEQRDLNKYFKLIAEDLAKSTDSESVLVYLHGNDDHNEMLYSIGNSGMLAESLAFVKLMKSDEKRIFSKAELPEKLVELGVFSLAFVRLYKGDEVLGDVILINAPRYLPEDISVLRVYAAQVALSTITFIQTNKAFDSSFIKRDLKLISEQQQLIMEDEIANDDSNINVDYLNVPFKYVGGDFCKFKKLAEKKYILFIADVMGHGIVSNYFVAMMKGAIELLLMETHSPSEILVRLNTILFNELDKLDVFVTAKMIYLDFESKVAYISNAGHTVPILVYKDKDSKRHCSLAQETAVLPLGVLKDAKYIEDEIDITDMELIALYTDGIIEVKNKEGQEFGVDNLGKYLISQLEQNKDDICKSIFSTLQEYSDNDEIKDDLTMVTLRVNDLNE